ncbi:MAG: sigma-70 family RNA polymerase sigma factor [Eubacterium sp.]|nr:sigma-70 family RNA polymerase sigma factor [Eubacterium sp.]
MPYMDSHNANRLVQTYADMILRICFTYLKQTMDAEDICQEVFLKLLGGEYQFESVAHEKSWIIRTTINACKDHLRSSFWRHAVDIDNAAEIAAPKEPDSDLVELVMTLPKNWRMSIYLYYYEGYMVKEIADMLGKSENTVSAYLARGRKRLRLLMEKEGNSETGRKVASRMKEV